MILETAGVIGDKGMKPKKTMDWKERNNKRVKAPFMRFSMFCEDRTKLPIHDPATGRTQRPRHIVQVILPETPRGEKIFESLAPGRQVYIRGRFTFNPRQGTNSEGQTQFYPNIQVYMTDLQFMDSPIERQAERILGVMAKAEVEINEGVKFNQEMIETIKNKVNIYLANQKEPGWEPREYLDNTIHEDTLRDTDPDNPDFAN